MGLRKGGLTTCVQAMGESQTAGAWRRNKAVEGSSYFGKAGTSRWLYVLGVTLQCIEGNWFMAVGVVALGYR